MRNLGWLKEKIDQLTPDERAEIDDYMVKRVAGDIRKRREEYDLQLASEHVEGAQKAMSGLNGMRGLSTGYRSLDELTRGLAGGELIILGGATSNGKTALAVNIAARVANNQHRVLFVTLEMTKQELTIRFIKAHSRFIDNSALIAYQKADEFSWQSVDGLIYNAIKELEVNLVVIDHLHYFTRELNNVAEDLGRITKEFKKNAVRHNIPIILISHTRKGDGNSIHELRGSSYIAQDADIVLMVSRDKQHPGQIAILCEKNRNRGVNPDNNLRSLNFMDTKITEKYEA